MSMNELFARRAVEFSARMTPPRERNGDTARIKFVPSSLSRKGSTMRKIHWLLGLATLLVLAACSTTPPDLEVQANPSRPFFASVAGTLSPTGPASFELVGTGDELRASHLGEISYVAQVEITSGSVGDEVVTDVLVETLTAANGDTLTILCLQTATLSGGVYNGTDSWTVIGGTGRFSGATGLGTGSTVVDLAASTFTKELTGTISY